MHSLVLAFLALPALVAGLALSDFAPKATGLTDSCQSVYDAQIPTCQANDFPSALNNCSADCAYELIAMQNTIIQGCSSDQKNKQLLIEVFLEHQGPTTLCKNIVFAGDQGDPAQINSTPLSTPVTSTTPLSTPAAMTTPLVTPTSSSPEPLTTTVRVTSYVQSTRVLTLHKSSGQCTSPTDTPTSTPSSAPSSPDASSPLVGSTPTSTPILVASSPSPTQGTSTIAIQTSDAPAQTGKSATACSKGDNSQHGGSLLDGSCASSDANSALDQALRQSMTLAAVAVIGSAYLLI